MKVLIHKRALFVIFCLGLLFQTGCSEVNPSSNVTDRPIVTQNNETMSPPLTFPVPSPIATVVPLTATPQPNTTRTTPASSPPSRPAFFQGEFPLAGTETCLLPCWYDLRIGSSDFSDVEQFFFDDLGFDNSTRVRWLRQDGVIELPVERDEFSIAYGWPHDAEGNVSHRLAFRFDRQTETLQQISFFFSWGTEPNLSLERVLTELGEPSYISLVISQSSAAEFASLDFVMVYEEGILIFYNGTITYELILSEEGVIEERTGEFCADNLDLPPRAITLMEPIPTKDALTPEVIENTRLWGGARPVSIEELLGVTPEEFASETNAKENPCFYYEAEP